VFSQQRISWICICCKLNQRKPTIDFYSADASSSVNIDEPLNSIITAVSANGGCYSAWLFLGYSYDTIRSKITRLDNATYGTLSYINSSTRKLKFDNTNSGNNAYVTVIHLNTSHF
jgi:hypothetical protein